MNRQVVAAGTFGMILTVGSSVRADFLMTPTFDVAPAIISTPNNGFPDQGSVVFARKGAAMYAIARQNNNTRWEVQVMDTVGLPNGFDGAPVAIYDSAQSIRGNRILACSHDKGPPGYMYCWSGSIGYSNSTNEYGIIFEVSASPAAVGVGTFNQFTSPALVGYTDTSGRWVRRMFARGQDNQIWYATLIDSGSWDGWYRMPFYSPGFRGDASAAVLSGGRVIVCGLVGAFGNGNLRFLCNLQNSDGTWGSWSNTAWDTGSQFYSVGGRPAMATSSEATFLFASPSGLDNHETAVCTQSGASSWSSGLTVGWGQFLTGPAAFASPSGSYVVSSALGRDWAVWYNVASCAAYPPDWTQIQAYCRGSVACVH